LKNEVLVIKTEKLFPIVGGYFQGLRRETNITLVKHLEKSAEWMARNEAEENPKFKQIIGYTAVIHPYIKKAFAYRRSIKDKDYPEKKLQGKYSWGLGGHIKRSDKKDSYILSSTSRELHEELKTSSYFLNPELIGFVNDDTDDVGKVHFGILFYCISDSAEIYPKDPEIESGRFENIVDLKKICETENVENWSRIILPELDQKFF